MYTINKLKPDRSINGLIPAIAALSVGVILGIFWGLEAAFTFIAMFFWAYAAYSLTTFVRTHNPAFLVPTAYQVFGGLLVYSSPTIRFQPRPPFFMFAAFGTLFTLAWMIYLVATKRLKWRGREVLELAAANVEESGDGYTARPLPAGKTGLSRDQIMAFAEFARRHLIAVPYVGKDQVVLVPVMMGREFGFILGLKADYSDETWVSFEFDGQVSVNISHRDYLYYKEALSFEQLCQSLGDLFVGFVESVARGEGVRVIDRLDAVGIGLFS
jgi:hypothetical protein